MILVKTLNRTRVSITTEDKFKQTASQTNLKPIYARSVINSLGTGMVSPFMGVYAVSLGASAAEMGWFQSSTNISNNLMQILWGRLSDNLKRRVPFIVLGSLIMSALWIPMLFVTNATQLIILLAFQALIGSMATPAWTALIGDLVPTCRFGRANANVNLWASIGSLIATLVSGFLMVAVMGTAQNMFFIPLIIAAAFGVTSSLVMLSLKERGNRAALGLRRRIASDIFGTLKHARKTPRFLKYCYVDGTYEFFMSMVWPILWITQVKVLGASMLQVALLSVAQTFVTIAFQGWAGRLADSWGRKPLIIFFRFGLLTVPLAYAFVPNMTVLIIVSTFWGFVQALGTASATAYLLDISPIEHRGSFAATYNLVVGVATFFGSLIGGYVSNYTIGLYGLIIGLQIVYFLSFFGRVVGVALHFTLPETLKKQK